MPHSIQSRTSTQTGNTSSTGHGSRSKGRFTRYRTTNPTSYVDESLFGNNPKPTDLRRTSSTGPLSSPGSLVACGGGVESVNSKLKATPAGEREVITHITKDLVRQLVVPHADPSGQSIILQHSEIERLKSSSKVLTEAEKHVISQKIQDQKMKEEEAANARRAELRAFDASRIQNAKLTDMEEEAREKSEHLLKRALELRSEQEDDIKKLNEYILEAKCHAIRDAQVLEHEQVDREMRDEERRLDDMMEAERLNAIRVQEEIEKRRREERYLRALQILDQMRDNEKKRLLELEAKDQENIQMKKILQRLMEEEKEKLENKKVQQTELRDELNKANDEMIKQKVTRKEQEKLLDLKVLEFQRQRAEREAAYEAEQERVKAEKEREVARLRAQQQRAQDEQAERDALRAKRAAEEAERVYRAKELEDARKKALTEDILARARVEQQTLKEHYLAVQAARDRAEFERVLRAQKELIAKEKEVEEAKRTDVKQHSEELRAQIKRREQERIAERNSFFEENVKSKEETRLRHSRLEQAKARKIDELRSLGIPDKYLSEVERKLQRPQHLSA